VKKRTDIFFFFTSSLVKTICNTFQARGLQLTEKRMRFKKSIVFFLLSVVCEELTSTYVLKIISYEICSSHQHVF